MAEPWEQVVSSDLAMHEQAGMWGKARSVVSECFPHEPGGFDYWVEVRNTFLLMGGKYTDETPLGYLARLQAGRLR